MKYLLMGGCDYGVMNVLRMAECRFYVQLGAQKPNRIDCRVHVCLS